MTGTDPGATADSGPARPLFPVVHIGNEGNLGNRMLRFLAGVRLAGLVPGCRLSGVSLPEWGIVLPDIPLGAGETLRLAAPDPDHGMALPLAALAARLRAGTLARVALTQYAQHLRNFPPREVCAGLFPVGAAAPTITTGPGELLISIRGAEIFAAPHPDYTLVPIAFYQELVAATGLVPVFLGQLDPNPYTAALRAAFPAARFVAARTPMADFAALRQARHIVPSVSTFAWLAAWLGAAEQVFLPLTGFLNPCQHPAIDLLPLDDPRYRFYLFPFNVAVPPDGVAAAHRAMAGAWRLMPPEMLAELRRGRPRFRLGLAAMREMFDEGFYLARYADVRAGIAAGWFRSGADHYAHAGFAEGREPFRLDRAWYCRAYPIAAIEVGQGDFADLHHHYAAVGRDRLYCPTPPEGASP